MNYYEVITEAVKDIAQNGYDSEERIQYWSEQIRLAAEKSLKSQAEIDANIREVMMSVYVSAVNKEKILRLNPGVSAFTLSQIKPKLHAELNRRIAASVNLIKLNRDESIAKTQSRFRGWATSVPAGGSDNVDKLAEKKTLRKALSTLPFEERRVVIDQSAKLFSAINTTVAVDGGAIAAVWHSHAGQRGYAGRPAHNARDGKVFLVRDSWAAQRGYVKPGGHEYTDEIEQPAEFIFCKCHYQFLFSLRALPKECLTAKGEKALAEARAKVVALS